MKASLILFFNLKVYIYWQDAVDGISSCAWRRELGRGKAVSWMEGCYSEIQGRFYDNVLILITSGICEQQIGHNETNNILFTL